jgi:diguanylate cyclase (GGDEF)-like protein
MADHDNLTGLLSRRRFQEEFERWGKYALRYERPMALMFLDLDKFKAVNDTYGHLGGDEYLLAVAEMLKKVLRSTDYVGRWGATNLRRCFPKQPLQPHVKSPPKLSGFSLQLPLLLPANPCSPRRASA